MSEQKFINKRMVLVINKLCMSKTGGAGSSNSNLREGASLGFVDRIYENEIFGQRIYPDLFHQAAAYMFYIIKNHIFLDGNKRTGLACAVTFLQWNNIMLAPFDEDHVFDVVVSVASGPNSPDEVVPRIAQWLKDMSVM